MEEDFNDWFEREWPREIMESERLQETLGILKDKGIFYTFSTRFRAPRCPICADTRSIVDGLTCPVCKEGDGG